MFFNVVSLFSHLSNGVLEVFVASNRNWLWQGAHKQDVIRWLTESLRGPERQAQKPAPGTLSSHKHWSLNCQHRRDARCCVDCCLCNRAKLLCCCRLPDGWILWGPSFFESLLLNHTLEVASACSASDGGGIPQNKAGSDVGLLKGMTHVYHKASLRRWLW